ncbi:BRO-E [Agrotis ipsilon multiple nucleopolyhedrovirus]|uniref:BRO-E n=1 Tax=Agrotis ipsilon multiple nucleopolyhedrovirus TaxID=208013 RepID=B6D630_9ABAC|nr:BRO-E [Agrotis ipsilon multiple nucleopolyhedrovirus]ACI28817.1 BRO-E [Agrotis ipsilon multiple nucleopolyhedrovirus]
MEPDIEETQRYLIKTIADKDTIIQDKDAQITKLLEAIILANSQCVNMSKRLADIIQDVVVKPQDSQLLHALAVCELSCNKYAFLRTQLRSLKRSIKRLQQSEQHEPVIIYQSDYVPNSINVLNKIKEQLPKDKFVAKHNKIQFVDDYDKDSLVELISKIK